MSLVFGIIALIFVLIGLVPFLGILEWIGGIFAILGFISGIIGVFAQKRKGNAITGFIINILVFLIAVVRILLGLGFLIL